MRLFILASCLAVELSAQTLVFEAFPVPVERGCYAFAMTTGADGNFWFTCTSDFARLGTTDLVGRMTPAGEVTLFRTPTPMSGPDGITAGPDGNVWFTMSGQVGRITPEGIITEFPVGTEGLVLGITAGPDGAVWFTEVLANKIGRITMDGVIAEFSVPTVASRPTAITKGPDGAIWFTERASGKIGRITTDGQITEFRIPTPNARPGGITTGPDGTLWFAERDKIARITTSGTITEIGRASSVGIGQFTLWNDGAVWFIEWNANKIGRITVAQSEVQEFTLPPPFTGPSSLTIGRDGALWFADGAWIGRVTLRTWSKRRSARSF